MEKEVRDCIDALLASIRNSDECVQFEKCKEELKKYPEVASQIDEFRKSIFLLQNSDRLTDTSEEMKKMFQRREELFKNELAEEYLTAELRICRMLQEISMELMNVTDLQLDSFEEVIVV